MTTFDLNGATITTSGNHPHLMGALRDELGVISPKDGCAPSGQCGCCTVLVDGQPRVSCVTPLRRVSGRSVTTLEGLSDEDVQRWSGAFCATGGSQCGFCTPGIILRFVGLEGLAVSQSPASHSLDKHFSDNQVPPDRNRAARALQAHLCRCTGWQTVLDAWEVAVGIAPIPASNQSECALPNGEGPGRRATLEGRSPQTVGPEVALGRGGFVADTAPLNALVAVPGDGPPDDPGSWVVADTLAEARRAAGKVQGLSLRHI